MGKDLFGFGLEIPSPKCNIPLTDSVPNSSYLFEKIIVIIFYSKQ